MPAAFATWGFLGLFAGIWKLVIVAVTIVLLFGRKPWLRHPLMRLARLADPTPLRPDRAAPPAKAPAGRWGNRLFVFLVVVAATAVAASIITRMTIAALNHPSR